MKTICVATMMYGHWEWTERLLDSVKSKKYNVELLLLNQGTTDEVREKIDLRGKMDFCSSVIHFDENLGIPKGWNILINYGLTNFSDIVLLIPNDVIFRHDTIDNLMEAWENKPFKNVISCSSIWNGEKKKHDFKNFPYAVYKPGYSWGWTGMNGLITQEFVDKVGLFDENLGPWWWNDTDMVFRIFKSGHTSMCVNNSRVWLTDHSTKRESFSKPELSSVYARNKKKFFEKHKDIGADINDMATRVWQHHWLIKKDGEVMSRSELRLDIGRGGTKGGDWLTVDIDANLNPDIVDDIRVLKNIKNDSVSEIFCSHILEHLVEKDVMPALKRLYEVLKPGGRLSLYVPDVRRAWKEYFDKKIGDDKLLETMVGADPTRSQYQVHLNMFWDSRLIKLFKEAGFVDVVDMPCRSGRYEFGLQGVKK